MKQKIIISAAFIALLLMFFWAVPVIASDEGSDKNSSDVSLNFSNPDSNSPNLTPEKDNHKTSSRKGKKLYPLFIFAGVAWFAMDQIRGNDPIVNGVPSAFDNTPPDSNNLIHSRLTDDRTMLFPHFPNFVVQQDIAIKVQALHEQSVQTGQFIQPPVFKRSGDYLIGRLDPLFISLKDNGNGKLGVLIAGLKNLKDGELVTLDLSDSGRSFRIEVDKSFSDSLGVYRTQLELDINTFCVSLDIMR